MGMGVLCLVCHCTWLCDPTTTPREWCCWRYRAEPSGRERHRVLGAVFGSPPLNRSPVVFTLMLANKAGLNDEAEQRMTPALWERVTRVFLQLCVALDIGLLASASAHRAKKHTGMESCPKTAAFATSPTAYCCASCSTCLPVSLITTMSCSGARPTPTSSRPSLTSSAASNLQLVAELPVTRHRLASRSRSKTGEASTSTTRCSRCRWHMQHPKRSRRCMPT